MGERRDAVLHLRVRASELAGYEEAAARADMTMSAWVRMVLGVAIGGSAEAARDEGSPRRVVAVAPPVAIEPPPAPPSRVAAPPQRQVVAPVLTKDGKIDKLATLRAGRSG